MSFLWAGYAIVLLYAAISDARAYRIPNWTSLTLALLFAAAVTLSGEPPMQFWKHLAVAGAVLAIGYLLFRWTGMGAGDAKLAAAIALWAGPGAFYVLTLSLAVAMSLLVLILVALRRVAAAVGKTRPAPAVLSRGAAAPLGVALSAAGVAASRYFDAALWAF